MPEASLKLGFNSKVYVMCPHGARSGGPEALHQLCAALRLCGAESYMAYVSNGNLTARVVVPYPGLHPQFKQYGTKSTCEIVDSPENVLIVPECYTRSNADMNTTMLAASFTKIRTAIWWLGGYQKGLHDQVKLFDGAVHLYQSHFARQSLGKPGSMLTDWINLPPGGILKPRTGKRVLWNPRRKQDLEPVRALLKAGAEWIPLEGVAGHDLVERYQSCTVYIDLGGQPGMDRIPREAAYYGCIPVIGKGMATSFQDMPIPQDYLFNPDDYPRIAAKVHYALNNWEEAQGKFCYYRDWISRSHERFDREVGDVFGVPLDIDPCDVEESDI